MHPSKYYLRKPKHLIAEEPEQADSGPIYKYPYDRLPKGHIRLFHLQPGDQLQGAFTHSRNGTYEAISYTWGKSARRKTCLIDGISVSIPASAADVLTYFRTEEVRTVWIDALCINQDDNVERAEQVANMAYIYSRCLRCLVWLGPDNGMAEAAFSSIFSILQNEPSAQSDVSVEHIYRNLSVHSEYDSGPLTWLFTRPWFSRKWVIQESALPEEVICHCGDVEIPFQDLIKAAGSILVMNLESLGINTQSDLIDAVSDIYYVHNIKDTGLANLLATTRYSRTTDARDAAYAVLGLTKEAVPVNYENSLAETLATATKTCFLKGLQCLAEVYHVTDNIPSWSPAWHLTDFDLLGETRNPLHADFMASEGLQMNVFDEQLLQLRCRCTVIDTVADTHGYLDQDDVLELQHCKERLHWIEEASRDSPYPDLLAARAFTLTAGVDYQSHKLADQRIVMQFKRLCEVYQSDLPAILQGIDRETMVYSRMVDAKPEEQDLLSIAGGIRFAAQFRVPFITTKGIIGMGPCSMAAGDLLVILHGCPWPAIVRPHSSKYKLLEICYAHGFMHGRKHWPMECKEAIITIV